jgi:hypothetical protein
LSQQSTPQRFITATAHTWVTWYIHGTAIAVAPTKSRRLSRIFVDLKVFVFCGFTKKECADTVANTLFFKINGKIILP